MTTREKLEQEVEWRKCSDPDTGCQYFLENYWHIKVPGGQTLFKLRPPQQEALTVWVTHQNTISLKARQIGWTTLAAGYLFWLVFFAPNRECVALSKTQSDAKRYISMARYGYKRLPQWMQDRGPKPVKGQDNQLQLGLANDSLILSLPSRDDPARGYTGYCIIVDEWASLNNPAEAWAAVEPAADAGGQIIGFSTAKGYGDWFHKFWSAAESGGNSFVPMFFAWDSVPERDEAWYEQKTRDFEPWQIRQEYPSSADEAFVATGNAVFDYDMLQQRVQVMAPSHVGDLRVDETGSPTFVREDDGGLWVWELPQPGMSYIVSADVASGSPEGDYSAAHVIKVDTKRVVARYRKRIEVEEFAELLDGLGRWFNDALLAPERNAHGIAVCNRLSHVTDYPNLYFHRRQNYSQSVTRNVGWQTTQDSKNLLVTELGAALRRGELILHCEDTLAELISFKRHVSSHGTERYGGAPHDDLVMSLGIGVAILRDQEVLEELNFGIDEGIPDFTLKFFDNLLVQAGLSANSGEPYTAGWTNRKGPRKK